MRVENIYSALASENVILQNVVKIRKKNRVYMMLVISSLQEQIFDYILAHLGVNTEGCVNHPIVMTEPVCNPNYCRQRK